MTNMTRWEPFNDMLKLSTAMDQLLSNAVISTFGRNQSLPIDVTETDDVYSVQVVAPGINPDNLDITVDAQTLTVKGEWQQPTAQEGTTFHVRERMTGQFQRTVQFPLSINADDVQAQYAHGILTLTLPKAESVKPRRISLQHEPRQLESVEPPVLQEQQVVA